MPHVTHTIGRVNVLAMKEKHREDSGINLRM
jgi:hypothetical protein